MIGQFERWWRWAIGSPSQLKRWRQRLGRRWLRGSAKPDTDGTKAVFRENS
jgi:hypothetical protein